MSVRSMATAFIAAWIVAAGAVVAGTPQPAAGGPVDLARRGLRAYEAAIELAEREPEEADRRLREARAAWRAVLGAGQGAGQGTGQATAELHRAIGTASLQLDEPGRAILAFRRAERLAPNDRRIRESLRAARDRVGVRVEPSLERRAASVLLFWRGWIDRVAMLWGAAALWGLGWLAFAVRGRLGTRDRAATAVGVIGLAVSALAGGSLAVERWYELARGDAVIVDAPAPAFRGPSEAVYDRAFAEPLPAGMELRVIERRGGWAQIELRDGRRGWVRLETFEPVRPRPAFGTATGAQPPD